MTKWHCSMLCSDMYEIEIQVRYEMSIDLVLSLAKYTTTLTLSILYLQLHLIFFNIQWSLTFTYYKQAFVQPFCLRVGQTLHNTTKGFQRIPVKKNCFQTLPITTNGWTNLCSSCWLLYTIKRPPPGLSKQFLSFRFLLLVCFLVYGGAS